MVLLTNAESLVEEVEFDMIKLCIYKKMQGHIEDTPGSDDILLEIDAAIEEYKRFLILKIENPDVGMSPTKSMDEVWHFHILDTKKYAEDCDRMFGTFLHHTPGYGPHDSPGRPHDWLGRVDGTAESFEEMKEHYRTQMDLGFGGFIESMEVMKKHYRARFGHDPISLPAWCVTDPDLVCE